MGKCQETSVKKTSLYVSLFFLAVVLVLGAGCVKKADDAKIASDVQGKFSQDSGLSGKQLTVQASEGTDGFSAINRRWSWSAGGKQGAGQDAVLDRAQLCPPFGLPLVYCPRAQQRHEVLDLELRPELQPLPRAITVHSRAGLVVLLVVDQRAAALIERGLTGPLASASSKHLTM